MRFADAARNPKTDDGIDDASKLLIQQLAQEDEKEGMSGRYSLRDKNKKRDEERQAEASGTVRALPPLNPT